MKIRTAFPHAHSPRHCSLRRRTGMLSTVVFGVLLHLVCDALAGSVEADRLFSASSVHPASFLLHHIILSLSSLSL